MSSLDHERIEDAEHPIDSYVDIEVSAVATLDGEYFTVDDDSEAAFFSVYLRTSEGLAECVADLKTRERAEDIADAFALLMQLDPDEDAETS